MEVGVRSTVVRRVEGSLTKKEDEELAQLNHARNMMSQGSAEAGPSFLQLQRQAGALSDHHVWPACATSSCAARLLDADALRA